MKVFSVESCCWTLADSCSRCVLLARVFAVLHCEVIFDGELVSMISYVTWVENVPPDGLCLQKPAREHKISFPLGFLDLQVTSVQTSILARPAVLTVTRGDSTLVGKLPHCLPLPVGRCFSSLPFHDVQPFEGPGSFLSLPVFGPRLCLLSSWSY